ncbi:DUF6573 family protein [Nitrosomonas eutropha]|jgi:hypothetical protein|uniref:Uncharacterized protein n=1 Tax=Nitrosomonas eutropha TaxID=916 RepID=A0ABX5M555_9PROT|nr:DUF6573 family protein [Nitrosomonas eutropha]PXV79112.1 hypothetical protein C8R14_12547 [Nitrosomonas eutropha]
MNEFFQASDVIHTHTRAQLIEDGDLIDVSETAREAGFMVPVAITRAVWRWRCTSAQAMTCPRLSPLCNLTKTKPAKCPEGAPYLPKPKEIPL